MNDPKEPKYEPEAPTLVPDSGRSAPRVPVDKNTAVKTPAPKSANDPGVFEAATMLEGALPPFTPVTGAPSVSANPAPAAPASIFGGVLIQPGTILGNRYQIIKILGEGGMGAVYKARDIELDREIALKVIRPELTSNPEILQRFKQELILARQVTDRNIIRIFDLGEAQGIKFITMEYVEGQSLYDILRKQGKVPVPEAVEIMKQMLSGLQAAHREGIVHRDLKPGNIMRDAQGRIVVMDFGLARSIGGDGMTRTGAMLGTMEYMSPEQAQALEVDARSDLYTVGLICYELLTGKMPYHADSAVASLLKRMQERAVPPSDWDASIPQPISELVSRCLERDPAQRWQSAQEIIDRIDEIEGRRPPSLMSRPPVSLNSVPISLRSAPASLSAPAAALPAQEGSKPEKSKRQVWLYVVLAMVAVAAITVALYNRKPTPSTAGPHPSVSVLVADFQNNTSDSLFDGTLEPMFNVALEGASFINAFNRGNARQLAEKLPNPSSTLDEQATRLVAVSQGINTIVTGSLSLRSGYRLSVEAIDAVTGKTIATADVTAANKDDLLLDIPKLAAPIRKALGDTTPESAQIAAAQGSFTASNLEAAHSFSMGMEQASSGKLQAALQSFSKAVELDANFARAYAGMAGVYGNMDQPQNAEKYAKLALQHVDRLTERERYRVRGQYYIRTENWQKCIEEYGELVKQYPADNTGEDNLAACYAFAMNLPKAMEEGAKAVKIAPKDVQTALNYAQYACYASDFATCERAARAAFQLNPQFEGAFVALAYAQMGQNQPAQAVETYQNLEKVSPWGASLAASGLANLALYEGRSREAIQILDKGVAADLAAKNPDLAADKYLLIAHANLLRADKQGALAAARKALAISQTAKVRFLAARTFAETGEIAEAKKLADSLVPEMQIASQAYAKLVLGEIALKEHNPRQAIQLFGEARDKVDTWIAHFDLGRAYLDAGAFAEADSEFDRCIQRRGEALEFFLDDMPTYSYLPLVYYYQGRDRQGLKSPGFADSYKTYLSIRGKSTEDPLVAEIRHSLGQ